MAFKFNEKNCFRPGVIEIIRCNQRDDFIINTISNNIQSFIKLFFSHRHTFVKSIPMFSNLWYYYLTSGNNLQTLGEEYAGLLRTNNEVIPTKTLQLLWIIYFVGGDELIKKCIHYLKTKAQTSTELKPNVKTFFEEILTFLNTKYFKDLVNQFHTSIFYINGTYYYFSNRITQMKYVLLRDWMKDQQFNENFKLLGYFSLLYSFLNLFQIVKKFRQEYRCENSDNELSISSYTSHNICILCADKRKNPTATPCGHIFCWKCLNDHLEYQENCPMCREKVKPSRIVLLQNFG